MGVPCHALDEPLLLPVWMQLALIALVRNPEVTFLSTSCWLWPPTPATATWFSSLLLQMSSNLGALFKRKWQRPSPTQDLSQITCACTTNLQELDDGY
jgi:hypothetical protein